MILGLVGGDFTCSMWCYLLNMGEAGRNPSLGLVQGYGQENTVCR
jgi:hypothetical protein